LGDPYGKIKGKIVLFSDWSILEKPYPEYLSYNMAKAGIDSLVKALAKQFAPDLTINAIAPGPMLKPPDLSDAENKEALAGTPLGRWGGAEEIAKAVLYLMNTDFVTGVILPVDGGRTIG
jgi:pteridine reductase